MKLKVVALISGGKDSCYNMMQCVAAGHQIVALANLCPVENTDELDSYMYQTVGHQAINLYAEAMGLPLYRRTIEGSSLDTGREYRKRDGDEVEDLYHLLKLVKDKEDVDAVSVGAILSDYQRVRVENVCVRLQLQPLAYLWRKDQESLLREIISSDLHAMIIKVAAFGLDPEKHLGKSLAEMEPYLKQLSHKYGVHVCGEGGEYETFTLDCPLFKKNIVIDSMETVVHSADAFAPVGYLRFSKMHVEHKENNSIGKILSLESCPCQNSIDMNQELEYTDEAEDIQDTVTSIVDLECQLNFGISPSYSTRTTQGYEWICGILGSHCEDPNIQDQTKQALSLLQGELNKMGWKLEHIVLVHLYVKNMSDFGAVNSVYQSFFGVSPPARVCVETPLPNGHLIQLDCLLHDWVKPMVNNIFHDKYVLHVQSLSHWAPANIGPYSQAVKVDEAVFCAGQIALVPCTMLLVQGGASVQASLAFGHVEKILEAMNSSLTLFHVLQAHCYVTHRSYIPFVRRVWERKLRRIHSEEQEGSYGVEENHCGPLVVIVVPSLPRGAAVELHVMAIHDNPRQRTSYSEAVEIPHGTIEYQVLQSSTGDFATVSLSLSLRPCVPDTEREQGMLRTLCSTFQSALEKAGSGPHPLCVRAFYRHDVPLARWLLAGFAESVRDTKDQRSPVVIPVPVQNLPIPQILHFSCWLSL
ncbi:diphthine--ammonia ligase isoform X2 [Scleropages formosus]|uniref:diphthine--ammonia ligase isoform X2 n=1 Tax=Scleropages formosus TaxID=113540 RepID=UPI0008784021|nr:diphthine--ammonia ligase isoform X2 [Scleropages formosus]